MAMAITTTGDRIHISSAAAITGTMAGIRIGMGTAELRAAARRALEAMAAAADILAAAAAVVTEAAVEDMDGEPRNSLGKKQS
ncbi:MAG: hypothetical protein ACLQVA_07745 [Candidatus Brocadiia bacterium]